MKKLILVDYEPRYVVLSVNHVRIRRGDSRFIRLTNRNDLQLTFLERLCSNVTACVHVFIFLFRKEGEASKEDADAFSPELHESRHSASPSSQAKVGNRGTSVPDHVGSIII